MSLAVTLQADTFALLIMRSLERAGLLGATVGAAVTIAQGPTLEALLALDLPQDARDLSAALIDICSDDAAIAKAGVATLLRLSDERSEWRYGIQTALAASGGMPAVAPAETRQYKLLRRFMVHGAARIALATFDDPAVPDRVIAATANEAGVPPPITVRVPAPEDWAGESMIDAIIAASAAAPGATVHVVGFERHARFREDGGAEALSTIADCIYAAVERLVEHPAPVVLWFTPALIATFQATGNQIFQWAGSSFDFRAQPDA